ncbi:MAG: Subtilisin DY [Stenotrophomonas maltophilia]|nr:MAG: Subtilisin DY [Stenotrophomonas maltophilia]
MPTELLIGVVDSGYAPEHAAQVVASRRFQLVADGIAKAPAQADALGHGSAVCAAILQAVPTVRLCLAQVFDARGVSSAAQIAAALDWLGEQGVRLINLSLGLRDDRAALREAVAARVAAGTLLCASSPAQGAAVFPAAYPGVLRVTGDARCAPEQWSWLATPQADFAAAVNGAQPGQAGASLGCASFCGHLAALLEQCPQSSNAELLSLMRERAHYRGAERRSRP